MGAAPVLFLGSYLLVRNPESEKYSWPKEFAAKEAGLAQADTLYVDLFDSLHSLDPFLFKMKAEQIEIH